jgi:peptide-methionine (R)-S-oxide reductase
MKDMTRRGFIYGAAAIGGVATLLGVNRVCSSAFADGVDSSTDNGPVKIVKFSDAGVQLGVTTVPKVRKTTAEWKAQLSALEFDVTRRAATEYAYSGKLEYEHRTGLYRCIDCDNALFDSKTKFESGTGWPSFYQPIAKENVTEKSDISLGMVRTEVKCTLCDAHLGHVFPDGPKPTGLRYCMNSAAMKFVEKKA